MNTVIDTGAESFCRDLEQCRRELLALRDRALLDRRLQIARELRHAAVLIERVLARREQREAL